MDEAKIRKDVRKGYGEIARKSQAGENTSTPSCCGEVEVSSTQSCCGPTAAVPETQGCGCGDANLEFSESIGYSADEISKIPDGANLGLGCGNPVALASLEEGETVLDLGSGAGIDCFLAANRVGKSGNVIGVDMTADMLDRARENASKGNYENVEFRLGEIENLPVADNTVDVIISNCVINLSPNKARVFAEAFRVLKPGGRLMVSDIVLLKELPDEVKKSIEAYVGCVAGADMKHVYLDTIKKAGFSEVDIVGETSFSGEAVTESPTISAGIERHKLDPDKVYDLTSSIASIKVQATKPA